MPSELTFRVRQPRTSLGSLSPGTLVLETDNWDDFRHKVQFHLHIVKTGGQEKRLGAVKVLQRSKQSETPGEMRRTTKLPDRFSALDENFISLGQGDEYYRSLYTELGNDVGPVLVALRDIAWQPQLAHEFEPTTAFRNALLRFNSAQRARRFGRAWAMNEPVGESPEFSYLARIEGAEADLTVDFDLDPRDVIPGRVVGIIGRNAVGKTRFLALLGQDLTQISRTSAERVTEREQRFPKGRPLFTRVLAVSYSAFDQFPRPRGPVFSYAYCGIRSESGGLSRKELVSAYRRNQSRIRDLQRHDQWLDAMQTILGDQSPATLDSLTREIEVEGNEDAEVSLLSSGQAILSHVATALLAWIEPNSLVLFDEPETHLHPNAVASLFVSLTKILKTFDSFAIVATHSPVVIQQLPAKRVLVFRRKGNVTTAERLPLESFGESVSELTRHVFETVEVESLYRNTLHELAKDESLDEVLARFPDGLSLSARAYLLAQYAKREKEKP